jgi:putative PIN family toxin of toxin-antitoxin system
MNVVVDTNVFISSFLGTGHPRKIIDLWKNGRIKLCLSGDIIDEYLRVLDRLSLSEEKETQEILAVFARGYNLLFTQKPKKITILLDDPEDAKFFECAMELKTSYIISGDRHLLNIKEYFGFKIVSPADFMKLIQGGG